MFFSHPQTRIAVRSGAIIKTPDILKERHTPRPFRVGAKDTEEDAVLEVTYDATKDRNSWMGSWGTWNPKSHAPP